MAFKMKGHALPGINQRGYENMPDGRSKSAAFQKNGDFKQDLQAGAIAGATAGEVAGQKKHHDEDPNTYKLGVNELGEDPIDVIARKSHEKFKHHDSFSNKIKRNVRKFKTAMGIDLPPPRKN